MRIRNVNEQPNYGLDFEDRQGDATKGILFAVVGMLVGIGIQFLMGGVLEMRMGWISGAVMGAAISLGYSFGKGQSGIIRQVTIVVTSFVGATIGVWGGWAIYFYRSGWVRDVFGGFTFVWDAFFAGVTEGAIVQDILFGSIMAIIVAWKTWSGIGGREQDPEVLYDTEASNGLESLPTSSSSMDDVLNQDVPTQDVPTLDFEDIDTNKF